MNRLVIIGNGFDLAHGLPTSYKHFIDWYWRKVSYGIKFTMRDLIYYDGIVDIKIEHDYYSVDDLRIALKETVDYKTFIDAFRKVFKRVQDWGEYIIITNDFFKTINDKQSIQNWVDIENEYYLLLKECLKEEDNTKIENLNKEFEQVKNLFEQYLIEEVYNKYDFSGIELSDLITDIFKVMPRFLEASQDDSDYLQEFPREDKEDLISYDNYFLESGKSHNTEERISELSYGNRNTFLSFNYTPSVEVYVKKLKSISKDEVSCYYGINDCVFIHGKLNDGNNKINFGFGDEMDDDYKTIEKKDDNEYLKYIKSFQYAQNNNYKRLLDFIDSEKFQVYLMGHSCGLSDRILLNTVFEHENCRSIKIYYYDKGNGEDDYTTIVQNISRHFNDKKLMRSKIVNKSLCKPLPQGVRFEKKK